MPAAVQGDWSDSEDELDNGVETDVLLGVPDGSIETQDDIKDAAVSRIGGLPVRACLPALLPSQQPPFSSSQCKICSNPMELLVQVWCPFEDSPMDRALYIWGCSDASCQKRDGSVRAWRGLRYNATYAAKLEKKLDKRGQQKAPSQPGYKPVDNPFSISASTASTTFGLGDQIFRSSASMSVEFSEKEDEQDDSEGNEHSSSEESLIIAMASTSIEESAWAAAPSYPSVYLSTVSEYIPQPPTAKIPSSARVEDPAEDGGKMDKSATWALEAYENSLEVDNVFDRFTKRVGHTGEQCLRYDLKGIPLPFASDKVFESLFPAPKVSLPITKADFKVVSDVKRSYSTRSIPLCPSCKSNRVFECQLMPNLINMLKHSTRDTEVDTQKLTDEQRIKAVQDAVQRVKEPGSRGMEWGTCMIFSCENDCCLDEKGEEANECWREEHVLVQWDD
ncbi:programmed cell death protein 2 [Phlebopus sp. FC_14]|nr:programmed cell death protein 2 [Phlebopus sp. FC_14]